MNDPKNEAEYFVVEQGNTNPRDWTTGWRFWETFSESLPAKLCAKDLGFAHVLKVNCIAEYSQGRLVKR